MGDDMPANYLNFSRVLVLIAVIIFVLAAFGISAPINLIAVGLAVWAAAALVP
jgi:hypothetical protein